MARGVRVGFGALAGLLAAAASLGVAELVAGAVRPAASPVTVVGGVVIDRTPVSLKDYAVRHFGTNDKLFLQLGIVAILTLFALALGVLALYFRRTGCAGVLAFGLVGALAAWSRPDRHRLDVLPSLAGAVAGVAVLWLLTARLALADRQRGDGVGTQVGETRVPDAAAPVPAGVAGPTAGPTADEAAGPAADESADESADPTAEPGAPSDGDTAPAEGPGPEGEPPAIPGQTGSAPRQAPAPGPRPGPSFDRRGFLIAASAAAAASGGAGLLGRKLGERRGAAAVASRSGVILPRPASPAAAVPAGAQLRVPGIKPFLTPTADFYRVDTALAVPRIDATTWRLRLHGLGVKRELTFSYADLLRRELIERDITLTCVSNEVGGPYVGNARWIGVRLADLLREAGVVAPSRGGPADQLVAHSVDGMTIGSPVETVFDGRDAMLALGMNGQPLPFAHGFPVRVLIPGLYGYVSACKWLRELELTTFAAYDAYWVRRSWSRQAPIKTESRIDTPKPFGNPKPGLVPVAGVAWAQHRGIDRVEVRVDGGAWQTARLAAEDTTDTWRQWMWPWQATSGPHRLEVRATDRDGVTQTEHRVGTVPDGATGWHSVVVSVD
ncbi:molybdopterin-dependent oxidoreductase [Streptomyces sp. NBC_01190]|uniref:molybdopterin-dependent oxidoreductase n=1 Tax=Streptomyces sp. NBC_01190 TaxID=2903767 RepID=UPI0038669060|nr:molybdopterin-dependent oxidoreductase [Streptomyces sp. NBC_01190]